MLTVAIRMTEHDEYGRCNGENPGSVNRRNLLRTAGAVGLGSVISTGAAASDRNGDETADTYTNPVYEPIFADPSIVRAPDRTYYAYGTQDASPAWDCDDAAMPILRSDDLVDWEYVGDVFEEWPDWKDDGFLWAPDIARYKGRYYVYYSYSEWGDENPGIGVATATDPEGPFEDHGKLFSSEEIGVENGTPTASSDLRPYADRQTLPDADHLPRTRTRGADVRSDVTTLPGNTASMPTSSRRGAAGRTRCHRRSVETQ